MASPTSQYELTQKIGPYLDRHLVFPLLEFIQLKKTFPENEVLQAKIELLQKTNMVDFAMDIYKNLNNTEEVPKDMTDRRTEVVKKLKSSQEGALPLVQFLSNANLVKQLRQDKAYNLQFLAEHKIGYEQIEALFEFAKFQFDCGNYSAAQEFLYHYRTLSTSNEKGFSALWGKFAADILMQDWETALEDMARLKDVIDAKNIFTPLNQLQQRVWLLHWSLFVFFNHENGRNAIIDLFFQDKYMNAIQTNAHHLLRYLAVAVVINKRRRNMLKDLIRVIQQESYTYSDPITEFLECLFVRYDFEGAQVKLRECEAVLKEDFFLNTVWEEFVENARLFIFETYCRIHQCIDIKMLAEKLNMDQEAAELWIVKLIRSAKLQAKIDSKAGTVIMGVQHAGIYENIIEKTRTLSFRTYELSSVMMRHSTFAEPARV
eukprot:CAMPEP_0198199476 /NCGR_PEP_ID=MMETSP1445-20131203/2769_1 /TAXON_ID=36898 /ORGANISM="Pyramimonas sp., Strain CCMP2087" /LENGTH=431 /DNA_ID=CAMNT_0043869333 /DNA_START=64 /DNA_END=1359 /DNA_ORIENTATION=+